MITVIIAAACLVIGAAIGLAVEWPSLREWRRLALRQAAVLHADDRTPLRPFRDAGPDDAEARARVGRRP